MKILLNNIISLYKSKMTWNEAFFSYKHHSFTFFNQWDRGFVSHLKFSRGKISNSLDAKMIIIFEITSNAIIQ